ncbi:hypothetical protein LINPERPRIM_LOCUS12535 [Linum perenne]
MTGYDSQRCFHLFDSEVYLATYFGEGERRRTRISRRISSGSDDIRSSSSFLLSPSAMVDASFFFIVLSVTGEIVSFILAD